MNMIEKCTLPVGLEYQGKIHRDVEIRPQKVGDTIAALENDRARKNESFLGLCVLARQIVRLGDISPEAITAELLMDLYEADMLAINDALRRLQTRQTSFRGGHEAPAEADAGAIENGIYGG